MKRTQNQNCHRSAVCIDASCVSDSVRVRWHAQDPKWGTSNNLRSQLNKVLRKYKNYYSVQMGRYVDVQCTDHLHSERLKKLWEKHGRIMSWLFTFIHQKLVKSTGLEGKRSPNFLSTNTYTKTTIQFLVSKYDHRLQTLLGWWTLHNGQGVGLYRLGYTNPYVPIPHEG